VAIVSLHLVIRVYNSLPFKRVFFGLGTREECGGLGEDAFYGWRGDAVVLEVYESGGLESLQDLRSCCGFLLRVTVEE
jgi:hypothetical protein